MKRTKTHNAWRSERAGASDELRTGSLAPSGQSTRSLETNIGLEVRRLRVSLDLTVAELAAASHISIGMVSKIENGAISASLGTLSAIAKALHVPLSQVLAETEERHDCSFDMNRLSPENSQFAH